MFLEPSGIAVEQESGDLYVVDRNNQRIDKFGPEGSLLFAWGWGVADGETRAAQTCTSTCFSGLAGTGSGEFNFPEGVAVDNDPLSESHGDLYVVDIRNLRVEKFDSTGKFLLMFGGEVNKTKDEEAGATEAEKDLCTSASSDACTSGVEGTANGQFGLREGESVAVGPDGTVYVGDVDRIEEFTPEGVYKSQVTLPDAGEVSDLAIDQTGGLYALSTELAGVRKYDSSGTELGEPRDLSGSPSRIAVGPAGELFLDDEGGGHHIFEYDNAGNEVASFDGGAEEASHGMAYGEIAGVLYALNQVSVRLLTPPSPGPLVTSGSVFASPIQPTGATLLAIVNTEGNDTTYRFEYGTSTSYGGSVPVPDGNIAAGFGDQPVKAELSGLSVDTSYHYRVVASNSSGTFIGPDETFRTLPPALIDSEWVTNVASSSATLEAQINPLGSDTTYRIEYGTGASYGTIVPSPEGDVGPGTSDSEIGVHLQGLLASTLYHYRLVTTNVLGVVMGEDRTFTTEPAHAGSATLPDRRSWEMVSPVNKQGAAVEPMTAEGGAIQASVEGNAIAYVSSAATEQDPQGNRNVEVTQVLSRRGPGGWSSQDIDTANGVPAQDAIGEGPEYRLFSLDLSLGYVEPRSPTPLPPLPRGAEKTIYLRDNATGSYEPLVTAENVASGAKFGYGEAAFRNLQFEGASPDLSHVVFRSFAALTPDSVESAENQSLYEWSDGRLRLVSVLPNGSPASAEDLRAFLGAGGELVRDAVSNDGSRIVWEAASGVSSVNRIYIRDLGREETIQINAAQGVKEEGKRDDAFQAASGDGSRIFFTSSSRLTTDSTVDREVAPKPDLYEFQITSGKEEPLSGKLTDLTVDQNAGEAAHVLYVIGTSEDGTSIYFAASGLLGDAAQQGATNGSPNLYVERYDGAWSPPKFVASLSNADAESIVSSPQRLENMAARSSPNGRYLSFMSSRSVTGYDNHDASSGMPDEEVYLYDADTGHVSCVSCDSTGARPNGMFDPGGYPGLLVDRLRAWDHRWLAALIPDWTTIATGLAIYQSRYLSDSGRLFFDSPDALASNDTNGTWDVYEYEPPGVGGCEPGGATFSQAAAGCVDLISSGGSAQESAFLDASETGDDVFFLTAAGLVPQDGDGLFDVYDARSCSASSPCLAAQPVAPPACSTSDSCKPSASPQPESFGAPSSQTFAGPGNVAPLAPKSLARTRSLTRAQKLSKALKACRSKTRRAPAVCERRARKRYRGKAARKSNANTSLPARAGR